MEHMLILQLLKKVMQIHQDLLLDIRDQNSHILVGENFKSTPNKFNFSSYSNQDQYELNESGGLEILISIILLKVI